MTQNILGDETSPYLLQHKNNPVHWHPWTENAFQIARKENKPVLLSIGYAACHWCHVMAHESFENIDIANLMNSLFINIKVDREERPDVDSIYQNALALTGQQGGWPLTMFLTPEGRPFWGGTYFPPEERWGRPGFPDILRRVADVFHNDKDAIVKNTATLTDALTRLAIPGEEESAMAIDAGILDQIAAQFMEQIDSTHGGIGQAPKFPQAYALDFLWRAYCRTGNSTFADAVTNTLTHMCQGGIYDHLAGGFARYSTDDRWLVPHFEKMLYDNAQLTDTLCTVWQQTKIPLFERRIRETISWILLEMAAPDGGFAATIDADSEGEEGKYYVWTEREIDQILGQDAVFFKSVYDVQADGNWEGRNILNRLGHLELLSAEEEARLTALAKRLRNARKQRTAPGWDDKVLTDWNGLMIAALARAGAVFSEPSWISAAEDAYGFIQSQMRAPSDTRVFRLLHAYRNGRSHITGMLDDYANMARAALVLLEITAKQDYLAQAEAWTQSLDRHFWDEDYGGYFFTADDAPDLITRQRHCHDNAVPAGNGTMLGVLARLWHLTGKPDYQTRAAGLYAAFSGLISKNFFPLTTFLNNTELMMSALQIVIIGDSKTETVSLQRALYDRCLPNAIVQIVPPDRPLPENHPACGKGQIDGKTSAYVCFGGTCSLPQTTSDALGALIDRATAT